MPDFFLDLDSIDPRMVEKEVKKHQAASQGSAASGGKGGKIELIFSAIDKNLSPELVSKTGAIFQFNVKGKYVYSKFLIPKLNLNKLR